MVAGWADIDVIATTGSTNADLTARAREGARSGTVLVAAHQSSGRGRLSRRWEAPPDTAVACSVLVAPHRPAAAWGWLPLVVGLSVVEGLGDATGLDALLKWPNDVLVADRKLCGILCEVVAREPEPCAVLGFGVNVALRSEQLPVPNATSTELEGSQASATDIVAAILDRLAAHYRTWDAGGTVATAYRERCATLGREVKVHLGEGTVTGQAVDIDDSGGLVVASTTGLRTFLAGDVVHLRRR